MGTCPQPRGSPWPAAWYRFDGSVGSVEGTRRTAGGSWSTPARISPLGAEAEAPQVAMSTSGAAEVAWSGWNEATHDYQLRATSLRPNAGWKASVLVSSEFEEAYGPHVAVDQGEHAVVVWNGEIELGAEIKSSVRDESSALVVSTAGSGSGTVSSQPAGIDCGAVCTAKSPEGTVVTLTAAAAAGSRFAGWSGGCAGVGPCTVEIGESQSSVGAEFTSTSAGGGSGGGGGGSTPTSRGPVCIAPGPVASVGTFVPTPQPGRVVPGVRARVGVTGPSSVRVTGTLTYGNGKARRVDLGTVAYHASGARNLRFALPGAVRPVLPLGTAVRVSLAVTATPDSTTDCATSGVVTDKLKLKVVKVLSTQQAGVS
jgi:Divergent InlB B-repeat domain